MSSSSEYSLGDAIADKFEESRFPVGGSVQCFLPHGMLDILVTRASVASELEISDSKHLSDDDRHLLDFIIGKAKTVFAVSLLSGLKGTKQLRKAMAMFLEHGFGDASLPITMTDNELASCPYFAKPWNKLKRMNFKREQWKLLAPVFPATSTRLDLEQDSIFPFTFVDEQSREGTFGNVYQVTIHPAHQEKPMLKVSRESSSL
jgi:hypothetical protein